MSLLFYLFTYLQSIDGTGNLSQQTSLQCLFTVNMVFSDEDKILKRLYLKGYTAEVDKRIFYGQSCWSEACPLN